MLSGRGLISISDHQTNQYVTFIKVKGLINNSRLYINLGGAQNFKSRVLA